MSTRKRTAAEWPRMKVRGARRRNARDEETVRTVGELADRFGQAVSDVIEVFAEVGRAWGQIFADAMDQIRRESRDEEIRSMHELGEELSVSPALVDDVIAEMLLHTTGTPTDWAIARQNLAALAAMTRI